MVRRGLHGRPAVIIAFALVALAGLTACGRSSLDDYLLPDGGHISDSGGDVQEGGHISDSGGDVQDGGHISDSGGDVQGLDNAACNATTCPTGCCDATGHCAAGSAITQCGAFGELCQNCTSEGFQLCDPTLHACGNPVASCGATNCAGCCDSNECLAGTDPNECGVSGQACLHCESTGLACTGQQCVLQCNASNCPGCCMGSTCMAGNTPLACGSGGQLCLDCQATGQGCGFVLGVQSGFCESVSSCDPGVCPGCCSGYDCLPGTDPNECGVGGETCENCANIGGVCVLSEGGSGGFCENNESCGPSTCPGCCANNTCLPGTADDDCGSGGYCTDCLNANEVCASGVCTAPCSPSTCPGCCDGNICAEGDQNFLCGTAGVVCQNCDPQGQTCTAGACH